MRNILRVINTLLLVLICIFLYTATVSFDRAREAELLRIKTMQQASSNGNQPAVSHQKSSGDFANMEYFSPEAESGGTLASVISSDPPGLNPLIANEASASAVFSLCTMTLAESFEISPDRKSYHIKLRRGVMWHSFTDPHTGIFHPAKEVTAHDLKFAVDVIKNPEVNCAALRSYYLDLQDVEIINDFELKITWAKEYYGSLDSTLSLFPLPRHFYAPDGKFDGKKFNDDHLRNRMIVGCGAYTFKDWENSRRISLVRNEAYPGFRFNAAPPVVNRTLEIIKLPNTQFQSLLAGKIGMLSLSPEQWMKRTGIAQFSTGKIKKYRYPGLAYSYIGYNHRMHCFRDAETRRALTMLINRQEILERLYYGLGSIAKGPFAPGSVYSDPALEPLPYDPAAAAELLKQAGWRDEDGDGILERDGKKFTFTMLQISGSSMQMRMLPMIKNYFAEAGIDMKLQIVEWSVLVDRLDKREFEACNLGWTGSIDPDPYQIFHSSQSAGNGSNFVSFRNKELDRLIMELRREFDMDKRIKTGRQIEKIIHDEQPYTFMFYPDNLLAISADYENVRIFPNGVYPLSFYMKKEAVK